MKSFIRYVSKHLRTYSICIISLILLNVIFFVVTFHSIMNAQLEDYAPHNMLQRVASSSTSSGISKEVVKQLKDYDIWALQLNQDGDCVWRVHVPTEIQTSFTLKEVAILSKGYLNGYPVFVWENGDGLLILGYPKDSYIKLTSNYLPLKAVKALPYFILGVLIFDVLFLFLLFIISKRRIIKNTRPIVHAIHMLSDGKQTILPVSGELSEVSDSINKASHIIAKQNEARANWISGISHDIRTPLSMILGYATRIADTSLSEHELKEQATIICRQSTKIKELVQDLNLVSQLEYDMQPLNKQIVRLSKLLRTYTADLLNTGLDDSYSLDLSITPSGEIIQFDCDERLFLRAVNNLVQNSIQHNPEGCNITISLDVYEDTIKLIIRDNGIGLSEEALQKLQTKPHYLNSVDECFDLRHGLGLLLVQQIVHVHGGTVQINSQKDYGFQTLLSFPLEC